MKFKNKKTVILPVMVVVGALCTSAHTGNKQYNILFIASDDMSSDLNAFGNPAGHTPNFARLAKSGINNDGVFSR